MFELTFTTINFTSHFPQAIIMTVYNPGTMKQFLDKYSPGLFQDLFSCITGGKSLSNKRRELQEQRKSKGHRKLLPSTEKSTKAEE